MPDSEVALFRTYQGRLKLEGLEFRLLPRDGLTLLALLALVDNGECTLKNCIVTLQKAGETRLALATLAEAGSAMKLEMPPTREPKQGPKLTIEGCFIRGEGDLIWTKASRPFGLDMTKSLAMLSGSLLNIEVKPEAKAPLKDAKTLVSLKSSTTYLGGPLVRLSWGKDPRGLVDVNCKARNCLFVPAEPNQTMMIELKGSDSDEKMLQDGGAWKWEGGSNTYGNFKALLQQTPVGDEMMSMVAWSKDKWTKEYGEESSTFAADPVKKPSETTSFARMEPDQLSPPRQSSDSGVPLDSLPKPAVTRSSDTESEP